MTQLKQITINQVDNGFTIIVNSHNPRENKQFVAANDDEVKAMLRGFADKFTSITEPPKA